MGNMANEINDVVEDFGRLMDQSQSATDCRVKAKIVKKSTQFTVTEVFLEIQKKDEEYTRGAWVTIFEGSEGNKRFNVSGEHDLEVWADIIKYLKSA
jgi:hypothetical protein